MAGPREILTDLRVSKESAFSIEDTGGTFPEVPSIGQFALVGGILYQYTNVQGVETWYPLNTNGQDSYIHNQSVASTEWTINHNFGTDELIFFTYDNNSKLVEGDFVLVDVNTFKVQFTSAISGKAVVYFATTTTVGKLSSNTIQTDELKPKSGTDILFSGNLVPTLDNTFSIGSPTNKIKDLYISANTIYLGDSTTLSGTQVTVSAPTAPTSLSEKPVINASELSTTPFTYNNGTTNITVEPLLSLKNGAGDTYGFRLNLTTSDIEVISPTGLANLVVGTINGETADLASKQDVSEKGQPNGYASLDSAGQIPSTQLPSYVDDVLEFASVSAFPATGETGKIYVALDADTTYRWGGSTYIQISSIPVLTITEDFITTDGTETSFTIPNGQLFVVGANQLEIYVEGIRWRNGREYTEDSTGTSITLNVSMNSGDEIIFRITKLV